MSQILHQPFQPLSFSIEQLVDRILENRKITQCDRQCLMEIALADNPLSLEDQIRLNWIFQALRRGAVRVEE